MTVVQAEKAAHCDGVQLGRQPITTACDLENSLSRHSMTHHDSPEECRTIGALFWF